MKVSELIDSKEVLKEGWNNLFSNEITLSYDILQNYGTKYHTEYYAQFEDEKHNEIATIFLWGGDPSSKDLSNKALEEMVVKRVAEILKRAEKGK